MPIIKSAKKRVRLAKKATAKNARTKRGLRASLKVFGASLGTAKAGDAHRKAQSALDKAGKKKVMHKNKVARKQRQLAARAKAAGLKPTKKALSKKAPAKTTTKRAPVKKTPAKKTTKK